MLNIELSGSQFTYQHTDSSFPSTCLVSLARYHFWTRVEWRLGQVEG